MKGGEACNTRLSLGLCSPRPVEKQQQQAKLQPKPPVLFNVLFPPKLKEEVVMDDSDRSSLKAAIDESELDPKKNKTNTRKKQRLTKEQTTLLEDCFKEHPTLIPTQKLELAKQLKLRPRQVEVWFQNRRARNKSKQTEVDCEFLKKCCERLSDENGILKKELQELRSMKLGSSSGTPFYIQLCKVETLKICPSCEMVERTVDGKNGIGALDVVAKKGSNKLFTGMDEYDGTIAL